VAVTFLLFLLFLPFLQKTFRLFPESELHGAEVRPEKPKWTSAAWFDGSYAAQFEKSFAFRVGFRAVCIKTWNQLALALFDRLGGGQGTRVTRGRDGWLYETEYIEHALRPRRMAPEERARYRDEVKGLQDELARRGIGFVLVISPSKVEWLPEHLPADTPPRDPERVGQSTYETLIPELQAAGVRVVDARALFAAWKPEEPELFVRCGTHWSYYGCFLFTRHLLAQLSREWPDRYRVPELEGVTRQPPVGSDKDLADLLNLLRFAPAELPVPYPEIAVDPLPLAGRPDVLMMGDSFTFTLVDSLKRSRAVGALDLLYYHQRLYRYPPAEMDGYFLKHADYDTGPIDHAALDWQTLLLDKDLVIVECNEMLLNQKLWGFAHGALAFLRGEEAP